MIYFGDLSLFWCVQNSSHSVGVRTPRAHTLQHMNDSSHFICKVSPCINCVYLGIFYIQLVHYKILSKEIPSYILDEALHSFDL